jgi:hypothetical protein
VLLVETHNCGDVSTVDAAACVMTAHFSSGWVTLGPDGPTGVGTITGSVVLAHAAA